MATLYCKAAGGNWTAAATWSNISSAGVDSSGPPTASDDTICDVGSATSAALVVDASTAVAKTLNCTGFINTLTHNAFNLTISGSVTLVSGMTYTPLATSTLTLAAAGTLTTGGKLLPLLVLSAGLTTLGDNLSFMVSAVISLTLNGNLLDLNGKTVSGNSSTNRILVRSNTLGTARTITMSAGTFANADFRDITTSPSTNLSAITGLSGDCGGNTGTFTTSVTQTYTGGTDNWSTLARWTSRVPLPQDDVLMSGVTGGTITGDMPRLGRAIDWTGAAGSPVWTMNTITNTMYGSLTLTGLTTLSSFGAAGTLVMESQARTGTLFLTSNGKSFTATGNRAEPLQISVFGATLKLLDSGSAASNSGTNDTFQITAGTFDIDTFTFTCTRAVFTAGTTFNATTGTLVNTGAGAISFQTVSAGTSTISLTNTSASSKTFAGNGQTFYNLLVVGSGAGAVIITGANTFNRLYTDGAGTKTITLPGNTTTTLLSGLGLGNVTNVITFTASTNSATISKVGGTVSWDYVNLTNIPSTGGATFYAGANSVDGGGNTGWIFTAAPIIISNGIKSSLSYQQGWI